MRSAEPARTPTGSPSSLLATAYPPPPAGKLLDDPAVARADDEDREGGREREEDREPDVFAERLERFLRSVGARRETVGAEPDPRQDRDERDLVERAGLAGSFGAPRSTRRAVFPKVIGPTSPMRGCSVRSRRFIRIADAVAACMPRTRGTRSRTGSRKPSLLRRTTSQEYARAVVICDRRDRIATSGRTYGHVPEGPEILNAALTGQAPILTSR